MMTMMLMTIDSDDIDNNDDEKINYQANPARVVYLSMRFLIKMFKSGSRLRNILVRNISVKKNPSGTFPSG